MTIDCTFMSMEEAIKIAAKYKPDITGIYIMTTFAKNAVRMLEKLREVNPESIYATGGPLPTSYPYKFAEIFDFVFKGEALKSFPDFCCDYLNAFKRIEFLKNMEPSIYSGILSLKMGFMDSPEVHLTKHEIDESPIPDRTGFEHNKYQELCYKYTGKKTATIMTTYGCPFSCDFCSKPIFGNELRFRNMEKVFEEIKDIVSYGYDSLWIADDLFTYNTQFLKSFCSRFIKEGLQISWSCLSRADSVPDEIAKMMKSAGCSRVYLGIESGNDFVLKLMNKNLDTAQVRRGVEIFKKNGIECAGFFLVGYPGETVETIEETFDFALSLGLDKISFNVPYPLPGSKLYERVTGISEDDWIFENETRFLYKSEFDEKWMERRIQDTYEMFRCKKADFIK